MRAQINDRDFEQLSAYMDGQLAPTEQRKLEERLRARPDLQEALDDLRRTRALLRSAPRRRAPRNFTLTPEMVGEQAGRRRRGGFFNTLFPTLSFASAVATLLLIATLLLDLTPGLSPSTAAVPEAPAAGEDARLMTKEGGPAGAAPQMEAAPSIMSENPAEPAAGEANSAGPVIIWGPQGGYGMGGGNGSPDVAWGRGGGGGGGMEGLGGGGAGPWGVDGGGQIIVPQESVDSMQPDNYVAPEAVQPDPSISGTGPILGVAPTDQTGQIIEREAINQGLPVEQQPAPTVVEEQPVPQQDADVAQERVLGVPLRLAQIVLAVLAVVTGVAAFLLRRR